MIFKAAFSCKERLFLMGWSKKIFQNCMDKKTSGKFAIVSFGNSIYNVP